MFKLIGRGGEVQEFSKSNTNKELCNSNFLVYLHDWTRFQEDIITELPTSPASIIGNFLENDFWTPPLPFNFAHLVKLIM